VGDFVTDSTQMRASTLHTQNENVVMREGK